MLVERARRAAQKQANGPLDVRYFVFALDGGLLFADAVAEALFSPSAPFTPARVRAKDAGGDEDRI